MKYFLHDTSAFDDEKISDLFFNYGYEGLGLFYTALEKIGKQEKPIKTDVLLSQLRVGKRLKKCWNFIEEIGLISSTNGESFSKQLLNFSEKYQIKKEKNRIKISEWRKHQDVEKNVTSYEPNCNRPKVKESKVNINKEDNILTWRNDFETYKTELKGAYKSFLSNGNILQLQQKYNPNLNIPLTIEKSVANYWIKEIGWKKKKASKTAVIDWPQTFINCLSISGNKVYFEKNNIQSAKFKDVEYKQLT